MLFRIGRVNNNIVADCNYDDCEGPEEIAHIIVELDIIKKRLVERYEHWK
jgi:hypothetical protein